jgi:FtsP/CotA-like multicopper oxidase with cupredoxin domain
MLLAALRATGSLFELRLLLQRLARVDSAPSAQLRAVEGLSAARGRASLRRARLLALGLASLLVGCGSSAQPSPPRSAAVARKQAPRQFLRVSAARRSVELTLIAGDGPSNNGFNFDGYGRGELLVSVPRGWRVTVRCKNSAALRNSCGVVSGPQATALAFPGASTPNPTIGLGSGETATFSFTPTRAGVYRLASLVPGHEQARMYAVLEVRRGGQPSISARPGP